MSILNNVYKAFSNLDRDFAHSKKSRSQFIADKFGGDINIGSIIILDAIREEGVSDEPEDIAKLSFIKDSFKFFQDNAHRLDKMETFSTRSDDLMFEFLGILYTANSSGTNQVATTQATLWDSPEHALHFISDGEHTVYAPLERCTVFNVYNENMLGFMQRNFGNGASGINIGDFCRSANGGRLRLIQPAAVKRYVQ